MAADDIVRGAAKAGSWLSDLLGVADEAISPAVAKAARNMMKNNFSRFYQGDDYGAGDLDVLAATKRVIDSDVPTEALKRIVSLSNRNVSNAFNSKVMSPKTKQALRRMADTGDNIDYMLYPSIAHAYKLMNNYRGLSPEAVRIVSRSIENTPFRVDPIKYPDSMANDEAYIATNALDEIPGFEKTVRAEELLSEFGADSPAVSMFSSFIDDGMSPADAREAVRALLG